MKLVAEYNFVVNLFRDTNINIIFYIIGHTQKSFHT